MKKESSSQKPENSCTSQNDWHASFQHRLYMRDLEDLESYRKVRRMNTLHDMGMGSIALVLCGSVLLFALQISKITGQEDKRDQNTSVVKQDTTQNVTPKHSTPYIK